MLAGAGSGKTRVLACRTAYIIHSGLARAWQILALTFTNKAAGELKNRVCEMAGDVGSRVCAGTFHSIFAQLMRQEGRNIGLNANFVIMDSDDAKRLVKQIMQELGVSTETYPPNRVYGMISAAKNRKTTAEEYELRAHISPMEKVVALVYPVYQKRLAMMAGMDFDDLLLQPLRAMQVYPEFLARLQERFRYVMVDEFQDTNPVQYDLVRLIAEKHNNICVVGDDDQSIYSFRGATVGNILNFQNDWKKCKVIRLEQNYRSTKSILSVANEVIKNNGHRHEKQLWTEQSSGKPVDLIVAEDESDEARHFITAIDDWQRNSGKGYRSSAILYRTNVQSYAFEQGLRSAGIPYRVIGGLKFYERKEIKDLLAYVRLLVNPSDDISFERVANYPPRGISEELLVQLRNMSGRNESLLSIARLYTQDSAQQPRRRKSLEIFLKLIDAFTKSAMEVSFPLLVAEIVHQTGLKERLQDEEKGDKSKADSKVANVERLIAEIRDYWEKHEESDAEVGQDPLARISAYLEEVSLITDADQKDTGDDYVSLMTLHSAKGLEFPLVLIGGVEEGLLPYRPFDNSDSDTEEERRLFYVGITRAMERLILGTADCRMVYGTTRYSAPSSFLKEIPDELLNKIEFKRSYQQTSYFSGSLGSPAIPTRKPSSFNQIPQRSKNPITEKRGSSSATLGRLQSMPSPITPPTASDLSFMAPPITSPSGGRLLQGEELRNGLLVRHQKYDLGVVVRFSKIPGDWEVIVDFDEHGSKTLRLNYAKLEIVKGK